MCYKTSKILVLLSLSSSSYTNIFNADFFTSAVTPNSSSEYVNKTLASRDFFDKNDNADDILSLFSIAMMLSLSSLSVSFSSSLSST